MKCALAAVIAAVLASLAAPAAAQSAATQPVTLRFGYFPNLTHATALVGIQKGFVATALGSTLAGVVARSKRTNEYDPFSCHRVAGLHSGESSKPSLLPTTPLT